MDKICKLNGTEDIYFDCLFYNIDCCLSIGTIRHFMCGLASGLTTNGLRPDGFA